MQPHVQRVDGWAFAVWYCYLFLIRVTEHKQVNPVIGISSVNRDTYIESYCDMY